MSLDQPITISLNQKEIELIIAGLDSVWWDNKQLKTRLNIAKKIESEVTITRAEGNEAGKTLTERWDFYVKRKASEEGER